MERNISQKLLEWKGREDRKPLILRGVRQCGKTYSLEVLGRTFPRYHLVNFEKQKQLCGVFDGDLSPDKILQSLEFQLDAGINPKEDLLILDEIQDCPRAMTALKYFREEMPDLALCCAGSHIGVASSDASFPVGKVSFMNMYPLSFGEFLLNYSERIYTSTLDMISTGFSQVADQKLFELVKLYWLVGGLPEAVQAFLKRRQNLRDGLLACREVHGQLVNGYTSDFAKHCGGLNAHHINLVFQNIPSQLQKLRDGSSKRFHFSGIVPNRSKYSQLSGPIEWLAKSGLALKFNQLSKIERPLKSYAVENFFRLFLFDTGMLSSLLEIEWTDLLGVDPFSYKGFIAENFISQELRFLEIPSYSFNEKRSEVEFVLDYSGHTIPMEVKSGTNMKSKSLSSFKQRYEPKIAVKFSGRPLRYEAGQVSVPLYLSSFLPQILEEVV